MIRRPLAVLALLSAAAAARADQDVGLRIFDGVSVTSASVGPAGSSPLKVNKGGTTYGVTLVNPGDPQASRVRVQTSSGVRAIKKYSACANMPLEPIPSSLCLGNGMCNKSGPGIEFAKRHLWSNNYGPGYVTAPPNRKWFLDAIVKPQTGNLSMPNGNYGVDCGDATTFARVCRGWGYGSWSQTYNHNNASPGDNCSVRWNPGANKWVNLGCGRGCNNKRLLCTNPLPKCANGYDDDGDCLTDMADPDCSGPADNSE